MQVLGVGLAGLGTVGSSFYTLLRRNGGALQERFGTQVQVKAVCVRDTGRPRDGVPADLMVADLQVLLENPEVQVVVELIGGVEVPLQLLRSALQRGKHVITANKALLAEHGQELFALAAAHQVELLFEASICGGIPIVKVIRESLAGNQIQEVTGIVNGTTNYILTRMGDDQLTYAEALKEAQERGLAERDPSLDVSGGDAAQKISLLAGLAFGGWVDWKQVSREGIESITPKDITFAAFAGFVFRLVATARLMEDGRPAVIVYPALVPVAHPLAAVRLEYNAVLVESDFQGTSVYTGRGAGGEATASSVSADLADLVDRFSRPLGRGRPAANSTTRELFPVDDLTFKYFFHFVTENRPGIWATVTGLLADHGVNIESVHQKWEDRTQPSDLYVLVDPVAEQRAVAALKAIREAPGIAPASRYYRILPEAGT